MRDERHATVRAGEEEIVIGPEELVLADEARPQRGVHGNARDSLDRLVGSIDTLIVTRPGRPECLVPRIPGEVVESPLDVGGITRRAPLRGAVRRAVGHSDPSADVYL